uniref:Uncharacterized protein n=1 Tax=Amblyomma triste TaxID=251400 RepID=A0A023G3G1_AMBTT
MKGSLCFVLFIAFSDVSVQAIYLTLGQDPCEAPCDPNYGDLHCRDGCLCCPRMENPRLGRCFNPNIKIPQGYSDPRQMPRLARNVRPPLPRLPPSAAPRPQPWKPELPPRPGSAGARPRPQMPGDTRENLLHSPMPRQTRENPLYSPMPRQTRENPLYSPMPRQTRENPLYSPMPGETRENPLYSPMPASSGAHGMSPLQRQPGARPMPGSPMTSARTQVSTSMTSRPLSPITESSAAPTLPRAPRPPAQHRSPPRSPH